VVGPGRELLVSANLSPLFVIAGMLWTYGIAAAKTLKVEASGDAGGFFRKF
jgi:hypothetical protein